MSANTTINLQTAGESERESSVTEMTSLGGSVPSIVTGVCLLCFLAASFSLYHRRMVIRRKRDYDVIEFLKVVRPDLIGPEGNIIRTRFYMTRPVPGSTPAPNRREKLSTRTYTAAIENEAFEPEDDVSPLRSRCPYCSREMSNTPKTIERVATRKPPDVKDYNPGHSVDSRNVHTRLSENEPLNISHLTSKTKNLNYNTEIYTKSESTINPQYSEGQQRFELRGDSLVLVDFSQNSFKQVHNVTSNYGQNEVRKLKPKFTTCARVSDERMVIRDDADRSTNRRKAVTQHSGDISTDDLRKSGRAAGLYGEVNFGSLSLPRRKADTNTSFFCSEKLGTEVPSGRSPVVETDHQIIRPIVTYM